MKRFLTAVVAATVLAGCTLNQSARNGDQILDAMYEHTVGKQFDAFAAIVRNQPESYKQTLNIYGDVKQVESGNVGEFSLNVNTSVDGKLKNSQFITEVDYLYEGVDYGEAELVDGVDPGAKERTELIGTLMGVNDVVYAQLQKHTDLNPRGEDQINFLKTVQSYTGQWLQLDEASFNDFAMMNDPEMNAAVLVEMEKVVDAMNVWDTSNFREVGGYYTFDVALSPEKVKTLGFAMLDAQMKLVEMDPMTSEEDKGMMGLLNAMMQEELESSDMAEMPMVKGKMRVRENNWAHFEFAGILSAPEYDYSMMDEDDAEPMMTMEDVMTFEFKHHAAETSFVTKQAGGEGVFECLLKNQKYSCSVDGEVVVTGVKTDNKMTVEIAEEDVAFGYNYNPKNGEYTGYFTDEYMKVSVDTFRFMNSGKKIELKMTLEEKGLQTTHMNVDVETRTLRGGLSLQAPANAVVADEEFCEFMNAIEGASGNIFSYSCGGMMMDDDYSDYGSCDSYMEEESECMHSDYEMSDEEMEVFMDDAEMEAFLAELLADIEAEEMAAPTAGLAYGPSRRRGTLSPKMKKEATMMVDRATTSVVADIARMEAAEAAMERASMFDAELVEGDGLVISTNSSMNSFDYGNYDRGYALDSNESSVAAREAAYRQALQDDDDFYALMRRAQ